jgi:hypothetical protein
VIWCDPLAMTDGCACFFAEARLRFRREDAAMNDGVDQGGWHD